MNLAFDLERAAAFLTPDDFAMSKEILCESAADIAAYSCGRYEDALAMIQEYSQVCGDQELSKNLKETERFVLEKIHEFRRR